jgi:hypothetical protein
MGADQGVDFTPWYLDSDGDYLRETGDESWDFAYLLHYTAFNTTLDCIRLASPEDATAVSNIIAGALAGSRWNWRSYE